MIEPPRERIGKMKSGRGQKESKSEQLAGVVTILLKETVKISPVLAETVYSIASLESQFDRRRLLQDIFPNWNP